MIGRYPKTAEFMALACFTIIAAWCWHDSFSRWHQRKLHLGIQHWTAHLEREKAKLLSNSEQLRHYAEHDDLTGLWNRRIIFERLHQEVNRSQRDHTPLSIILVDLDYFKQVNDTFGHSVGDLVLKQISAIFQNSVRSYDWVGRYGGEEFLLILPGANLTNAQIRAEQLRQAIVSAHFRYENVSIRMTASLGVASSFPASYEGLFNAVDAALYQAKSNGRNCIMSMETSPRTPAASSEGR